MRSKMHTLDLELQQLPVSQHLHIGGVPHKALRHQVACRRGRGQEGSSGVYVPRMPAQTAVHALHNLTTELLLRSIRSSPRKGTVPSDATSTPSNLVCMKGQSGEG